MTQRRFGEALLAAGLLGPEQLKKALEMQKILGGRLGTNLLELGYLDEQTLLERLGEFRACQTVDARTLESIPKPVLNAVPPKLVRRYGLVPFQVRGKTLLVASKDPGDPLQEDEISFMTGFMVRSHIALELHLEVALRRHFKAPLAQRFIALLRRQAAGNGGGPTPTAGGALPSPPSGPSTAPTAPAGASPSATPARPPVKAAGPTAAPASTAVSPPRPPGGTTPRSTASPSPTSEGVEYIELDDADLALLRGPEPDRNPAPEAEDDSGLLSWGSGLELPPSPDALLPPPPTLDSSTDPTERPVFEPDPNTDLVDPTDLDDEEDGVDDPIPATRDPETLLSWAARRLQAADIRDEIGDVLLDFAGAFFMRRALVIRRKDHLVGWMAGSGRIRELDMETSVPSIFFGLQEPDSFWLGPLPMLPANGDLLKALGGPPPKDCLVLPVSLRAKIVCYLYVDNLEAGVAGSPVADMKRLVAKAGLAFEVYILKNKIRMM